MNDFLSGYNFARQSDVVFSETIPENNSHRTYIVDEFELNDNDIVFCKTDNVLKLFEVLNDESEIKNIKLITHESDYPINESVFKLKPNCISKWYGINVNYKNKDLIPLPLGLANDYCPITLKINQLKREQTPEKLLYINHRIHNNIKDREWLYNFFETNNWCSVDIPDLSLDLYKKRLDMHKFILCPKGNGIDTHRLWESLYHGIIPIVESHVHYDCLEYLPALVVPSFKEITREFLELKFDSIKKSNYNLDKLKVSWWIKQIKNKVF